MSNTRLTIGACAAGLLLSACAATPPAFESYRVAELSAEERRELLLTDDSFGLESCAVFRRTEEAVPRQIPASIDAEAIDASLSDWGGPEGSVLISVQMDSASIRHYGVLASDLAAEEAETVAERLREHVRPTGSRRGWDGRLRVDLTTPIAVRAGYVIECAPELLNRGAIATALEAARDRMPQWIFVVRDEDGERRPSDRIAVAGYFVGEDGSVLADSVWSSSGRREIDGLVEEIAPLMRFRPALIDGVPRRVWVRFPITVQP